MALHIELGKNGENIAKQFLENVGYLILEENWRHLHKEIDIICKDESTLVFVEVKTRSGDFFQKPHEAVDLKKQLLLIDAAEAFIENYTDFNEIRFDIISILYNTNKMPIVEHIKEAFSPELNK